MIRLLALAAVAAATLVLASPVQAAAPNYILVSGPGLRKPILLADWNENLAFLAAVVKARKASGAGFRGRRRFDLAEFWAWQYLPRPTRPGQANQHGWFYPAHGSQPALVDMMAGGVRVPKVAPARALAILRRHGVPTRV